jgi:cytochrome P450
MEDEELPAQEMTVARLTDEATILIIAASETPAKVLALITFHLLRHPDLVCKIRKEVNGVPMGVSQRPSLSQLERLPYLSAVIKEGLRLHGGIVARSSRVCTSETLRIGNFDVPPGTPLSTSSYFIHRNPHLFPEPSQFLPERWLVKDETRELDRFLVAFGKGTRNCVGKNLGQAELYLALATVLKTFDFELFETDETDIEFGRDWYVMQPRKSSVGVRVVVKEGK